MTERAEVFEGLQIGAEALNAKGVAVAANRLLQSIGIDFGPELTSSRFRPRGKKFDTLVVPGRRWTAGSIDGRPTYDEIVYLLCSLLGNVTPTTPAGATNAREWLFTVNPNSADNFRTFTVEGGSDARAARFAHGVVTGLSMDISSEEITLSGDIIGKKYQDGITRTASPTEIPLIPIEPNDVSIFVDALFANIGTTLMERIFAATWGLGDKYEAIWPINAANQGTFPTVVEMAPDATLGLTFAQDAQGMAFLNAFEDGATRYVRIQSIGPEIEAGHNYEFRADFPVKAESVDPGTEGGLITSAWALRMVQDPNIAGLKVLVRNTRTAL
jgi:hypothetical protein